MQTVHGGIVSRGKSVMEGKGIIMSIEKRLHDASLNGNVYILNQLMQEDGLTLARVSTTCFNETPLHIAAMLGHLDFAKTVVGYLPQLAAKQDYQGFSPLHLASANGYFEIVKWLLQVNPNACLVRDEEGRIPLHLAIMNGQVDVAEELIRVKPEAAEYSLNTAGETLLHLAVKYNRFRSLKLLVELAGGSDHVLNTRDNNGNTILHLAASFKQTETVKYLLGAKVTVDAVNANGLTALDLVENMPKDLKVMEIFMLLSKTAGSRTGRIPQSGRGTSPVAESNVKACCHDCSRNMNLPKREDDWVDKKFASLSVAATVVASMAYQAVLNPPGGIWTDDSRNDGQLQFQTGISILSTTEITKAEMFWVCNTIAFISSFCILFLRVSGLRLKRKFLVWLLMVSMWITVTSMAVSYLVAMLVVQPVWKSTGVNKLIMVANIAIFSWLFLLFIVFLVYIFRFFILVYKKLRKRVSRISFLFWY